MEQAGAAVGQDQGVEALEDDGQLAVVVLAEGLVAARVGLGGDHLQAQVGLGGVGADVGVALQLVHVGQQVGGRAGGVTADAVAEGARVGVGVGEGVGDVVGVAVLPKPSMGTVWFPTLTIS